MKPMLIRGLSTVRLPTVAMTLNVKPASALPGQNVNNFLLWAKSRPLPKLQYSEAYSYYGTKGNLNFYADTTKKNGIVTKEGVTVSNDDSIRLSRNDAKSLQLIQNIYGTEIANDFQNSLYIEKVGRASFLRGKIYAYSVVRVENGTNFEIFLLKDLQKTISRAKYCQTRQCDVKKSS